MKSAPATGRAVERVDARLKATGKAEYAAEVAVAGVAHAVIVESAVAKGRITSIDTRAAEAARGVLVVLTHGNAPRLPAASKKTGPIDRVLQLLQEPRVLYSGQPVAVVVADSLEHAQHAASLVSVAYDAAAPVAAMQAALAAAYAPAPAPPSGSPIPTAGTSRPPSLEPTRRSTRRTAPPTRTTTPWSHTQPPPCGRATLGSPSTTRRRGSSACARNSRPSSTCRPRRSTS